MRKRLTAIGNSLGIIIDKPILELLGIDKDTELDVRTDGTGLIITPKATAAPAPPAPAQDAAPAVESKPPPPPGPPAAAPPPPGPPSASPPPPPGPPAPSPAPPPPSVPAEASTAGAEIVIKLRDKEVRRLAFDGDAFVIGRDKKADIHLDDRSLSRKHAKLERRGASFWVCDLDSANGTYVNGDVIQTPTRLHAEDIIGLGLYRVTLSGLSEAAEDTPVLKLTGPEGVHRFALVGEQVIIGRAGTCDISIGHKSISRRHIRIVVGDGSFTVEDLGSQNGVKINGKRIKKPTPVGLGDLITVCEFTMELGYLQDEESAAPGPDNRPRKSRTMLIDKSVIAKAAYVDGDASHADAAVQAGGRQQDSAQQKSDTGKFGGRK